MQSSLLKFMRRFEQEKAEKRKTPDSNSESQSTGEASRNGEGRAVKKQKLDDSTLDKLHEFTRVRGQKPTRGRQYSVQYDRAAATSAPAIVHKDVSELQRIADLSAISSKKPVSKPKPTKVQYTPLEQQFVSIKASHPEAVLFVECGYRYRFFGEDAEVAAKVLKISCYPDHNFLTASIPSYRLNIHLRRLVASGYKVGVVKQTETAAIKAAGSNKSGLFSRELAGLYTKSTLIGPDVEEPDSKTLSDGGGSFLMCICELPTKSAKKKAKEITIGFLAVQPSAGSIVYDQFQDTADMFSELETRLSHVQPVEILFPRGSTPRLEQALGDWRTYSGSDSNVLRVEELPESWFEYNNAFTTVSEFYAQQSNETGSTVSVLPEASDVCTNNIEAEAEELQAAIHLPPACICCLAALIRYLKPFNLQRVLSLKSNMQAFSTGAYCMRLNSQTLCSLEILKNQSDGKEKGSLFGVLHHTNTPFGRRHLIKWLLYPLRDISKIKARQEAISELIQTEKPSLFLLKTTLLKLPDLEQKLCSTYHKKCSPAEFYNLVRTLSQVAQQLGSFSEMAVSDLRSELLLQIIREVPMLLKGVQDIVESLSEAAAKETDYANLFVNLECFPDVLKEKEAISGIKQRLCDHKKLIRATLSSRTLDYVSVSGDQYLVEVKKKDLGKVPEDWDRISSTKLVTRYRPPYVVEALKELNQHQEQLLVHARMAWDTFLEGFSVSYGQHKKAIDLLATADCLLSLSVVAKMPGYVCPEMVQDRVIEIKDGRHPVIDLLLEGCFVANDTNLTASGLRSMIVTGPNMGGKSSYIKQVGLICILGQIGSYVPAVSAKLGILDGVYTRMGARDNILCGKSTFMVELLEASEIMKQATERSLVILDELGRGTSTHDGTAIAYATLNHFIEQVRCFTLFVTHYPLVIELEEKHLGAVANFHMAYIPVEEADSEFEKVVFLYHLERGRAAASYGLNVAALAGLPDAILATAHRKSKALEAEVTGKVSLTGKDTELGSLLKLLDSRHVESLPQAVRDYYSNQ